MKKALIVAALLPTLAWSTTPTQNETDTTFVYQDTQVEVENVDGETRVSVYNKQGGALTKVRETTYIDGNEVEKVYVGSPFASHGTLQSDHLNSTLATAWPPPMPTAIRPSTATCSISACACRCS